MDRGYLWIHFDRFTQPYFRKMSQYAVNESSVIISKNPPLKEEILYIRPVWIVGHDAYG